MIEVTLFSRENCHLCEEAHAALEVLQDKVPHQLRIVDIDSSPELKEAFGRTIPVVEVGPYRLKAPFTIQELQMTLGAAQDRVRHIQAVEDTAISDTVSSGARWTKADAFSYWFSRHYMAVFNLLVLIYLGLPLIAPVLMASGAPGPARLIYRAYSMVCHQLAYRSFFLFGDQAAYPRESAGVEGMITYSQATGLSEADEIEALNTARAFVGNEALGYKVALCERDIAIYGGILLFGLVFSLTGRRLPALPWYLWILIGLVPVGVDGLSQLLSQPPFNFWAYRESSPYLRTLTGGLFGLATAWFGYPLVEESMVETRQIMSDKFRRVSGIIKSIR